MDKVMSSYRQWIVCLFMVIISVPLSGQVQNNDLPVSRYGLPVIKGPEVYAKMIKADSDNALLDMRKILPSARFDVTYAGTNNFLKRKIYPTADLFMRAPAAHALVKVSEILRKKGFGLLLFDGYRPYSVTELFYEEIKDTTFVADPRKGSKHNRGMAIDLTMTDLKTGQPVQMPSGYDEASERAYHNYNGGDPSALKNRAILRDAMLQAGFQIFVYEWWHYDYRGWESCKTYDLWHDEIRKVNEQWPQGQKKKSSVD
jgi:D-alanyl-D-alanine dipeptidase